MVLAGLVLLLSGRLDDSPSEAAAPAGAAEVAVPTAADAGCIQGSGG